MVYVDYVGYRSTTLTSFQALCLLRHLDDFVALEALVSVYRHTISPPPISIRLTTTIPGNTGQVNVKQDGIGGSTWKVGDKTAIDVWYASSFLP